MEKVINLLYEIEEKANTIMKRADDEKLTLHQELEQNIKQFEKDISEKNKQKLDVLHEKVNKDLQTEIQSLKDDSEKQLKELEYYFSTNHDALVNKVFQHIIGA